MAERLANPTSAPHRRVAALLALLPLVGAMADARTENDRAARAETAWSGGYRLVQPRIVAQDDALGAPPAQRNGVNGWAQSFVELSLASDSFEIAYQTRTAREDGHFTFGAFVNEDDDFALHARLLRVGQIVGVPARLGIGLGAFATFFDVPDEKAYAVALIGRAEYDIPNAYPTVLSAELAVAPDITTFGDGESLIDFRLRANVAISDSAAAFIGVHVLEVDTEIDDREIDDGVHIGVRLGF